MQGIVSITVQESDLKGSEVDTPVPVILGHQSHRLPAQGFTKIGPAPIPLDLSVGATRRTVILSSYSGESTRLGYMRAEG